MRNLNLIHIYLFVFFNVAGIITTIYLFIRLILFVIAIEDAELEIKYSEPETLNEWLIEHHDGFTAMDSTERARWIRIYNEYSYLKFEQ